MEKEKVYTIEEAKNLFKFDKRRNWFVFLGNIVYNHKYTAPCTGCDGGGCYECGYKGKRICGCPVPFINPNTGNPLKVKGVDFEEVKFKWFGG